MAELDDALHRQMKWISIESRVNHDAINEIIHNGGNAVSISQPFIE
jgi:hypothetical protein